jgi:hypothetical protein
VETEVVLPEARTWRMQRLTETAVHRQILLTDPSPFLRYLAGMKAGEGRGPGQRPGGEPGTGGAEPHSWEKLFLIQ